MEVIYVIFSLLETILVFGFFTFPPIFLIIRFIKNIIGIIKSVKKSEDVKDSGVNYFLNAIIDILLFVVLIFCYGVVLRIITANIMNSM